MNTLAALNKETIYIKLDELEINRPYKITDAEKIASKYGDQLMVTIDYDEETSGTVYLPKRYLKRIPEDKIKDMKKFKLIYKGSTVFHDREIQQIKFENC